MERAIKRKKIAILGGGTASLTTAFELTSHANWQDKIDITIYQMGWRLGGKGASGRGDHGRIEEHGLHIWMGFYDNAFKMIRKVYKELVAQGLRDLDAPMGSWDAAFKKHSDIVIEEQIGDEWMPWIFDCPPNDRVPGEGKPLTLVDYLLMLLEWMFQQLKNWHNDSLRNDNNPPADMMFTHGEWLRNQAQAKRPSRHRNLEIDWVWMTETHDQMTRFRDYWKTNMDVLTDKDNHDLRRAFVLLDLGVTIFTGLRAMIDDYMEAHSISWMQLTSEILQELDFDSLDGDDFRHWLKDNGAAELSYQSGIIRCLYDLVFAYHNGECERPSFATGVALRSLLRIVFDYKGAIFWKMQAGMGDIVFGPMYQVLKARGVKFEFFHRVEKLYLSVDKKSIAKIDIARQVTLTTGEYDPLVDVKGLPCWPSQPRYEQITEGEELQKRNIDLESFWTEWKDKETKTLEVGKHFDEVVLGISIGSLPYICEELIAADIRWKNMLKKVETVRTMAMQLWLNVDLPGLGWTHKSPVMCGFVDPLNTWADMTHLIKQEQWPKQSHLKNIAYFCGPMVGGIPSRDEKGVVAKAHAEVKADALDFLNEPVKDLWPKFNWDQLVVAPTDKNSENLKGQDRFDGQYWCANINPTERYVLSVAGSTQYRIKASESGFRNLYLVGDWIDNGFNVGCIEATVMSGMQASHAICGYPALHSIVGHFHP